MHVKEAIEKRTSIRKFKDTPIPDNIVNELIEAGRLAPSGSNVQPTRYFIIKDKELKEKLKKKRAFEQDFVYDAPLIIVLCGNPKDYERFKEVKLKKGILSEKALISFERERAVRDISISSSFLVLRATELGLGSCYIGLINEDVLKKELSILKEWIIPYAVIFGYPDEPSQKSSRKDLNELILNNKNEEIK